MSQPERRAREAHAAVRVIWHLSGNLQDEAVRLAARGALVVEIGETPADERCLAEVDYGNRRCDLPAGHSEDHRWVGVRMRHRPAPARNLLAEAQAARAALSTEIGDMTAEQAVYVECTEVLIDLARQGDRGAFEDAARMFGIPEAEHADLWSGTRRRLGLPC